MNRYTGFVVLVVVGFLVGLVDLPNAHALSSETIYKSSPSRSGGSAVADTGSYRDLIRHFTQIERCSWNLRRQIRSDTFAGYGRQKRQNVLRQSLTGFYECLQKRTGIRIATGGASANDTLRLYMRMPRRIHKAEASGGETESGAGTEEATTTSAEGSGTGQTEASAQEGEASGQTEASGQAEASGSEGESGSGESGESGGESEESGSETQESETETEEEGSGSY